MDPPASKELRLDLHSDRTRVVLLVVTAAALAASYMACRAIVESRAGEQPRAFGAVGYF